MFFYKGKYKAAMEENEKIRSLIPDLQLEIKRLTEKERAFLVKIQSQEDYLKTLNNEFERIKELEVKASKLINIEKSALIADITRQAYQEVYEKERNFNKSIIRDLEGQIETIKQHRAANDGKIIEALRKDLRDRENLIEVLQNKSLIMKENLILLDKKFDIQCSATEKYRQQIEKLTLQLANYQKEDENIHKEILKENNLLKKSLESYKNDSQNFSQEKGKLIAEISLLKSQNDRMNENLQLSKLSNNTLIEELKNEKNRSQNLEVENARLLLEIEKLNSLKFQSEKMEAKKTVSSPDTQIEEKNFKYVYDDIERTFVKKLVDINLSDSSEPDNVIEDEIVIQTPAEKVEEKRIIFEEILSKGLREGFISAEEIKKIDFSKEKNIHDYFEAIEELEVADITILY